MLHLQSSRLNAGSCRFNHCAGRHAKFAGLTQRPIARVPAATARVADGNEDDDEGEGEATVAGKPLRAERLLANLGYGKRRECQMLVKKGRLTKRDGSKLKVGDKVCWGDVVLDGEELDPPSPLLVALHKPTGYVVTSPDDENIPDPVVYDLLPYRFGRRRPFLSCVGRLDKDTSGLLLLTDDGTLLHRINSPKRGIWKVYEATLAEPLTAKQAEAAARKFASGSLVLEGDYTPLLPAKLEMLGERVARVAICEGRYHQVRRMFAAVGSKVVALHRVSVGGLTLGSLPESEWRYLTPQELELVFGGPTAEEVLGGGAPAAAAAADRDGGATASSSSSSSSSGGGGASGDPTERLTKKEKKKGRKERRSVVVAEEEEGEELAVLDEQEGVADVEVLSYDDDNDDEEDEGPRRRRGSVAASEEEGEEQEGGGAAGEAERRPGKGRRLRRQRRAPAVRQGAVLDRAGDSMDEQQLDPAEYGDEASEVVASAGAGAGVRKYRDGAKWQRRREALRQMLPS